MEVQDSLEIRWFVPPGDSANKALESWFRSSQAEGRRCDHYLATGRRDLSFKTRIENAKPPKVETKYLVGSLGTVEVATHISGELQRWTKLSLVSNDLTEKGRAWLEVEKTRQLRKYAVTLSPLLA